MSNPIKHIASFLSGPLGLYLITLFGSAVGQMFAVHNRFAGARRFLQAVFPNKADHVYHRVDFVIVTLAGSVIGFIIFDPNTAYQALAAGFGWVGAMNILVTRGAQEIPAPAAANPRTGVEV